MHLVYQQFAHESEICEIRGHFGHFVHAAALCMLSATAEPSSAACRLQMDRDAGWGWPWAACAAVLHHGMHVPFIASAWQSLRNAAVSLAAPQTAGTAWHSAQDVCHTSAIAILQAAKACGAKGHSFEIDIFG